MPPEMLQLLVLGMVSGATLCSLSCLPYLAPYLIGTGSGFSDGVSATAVFLGGKILSYAMIGGLAALGGRAFLPHQSGTSGLLTGLLLIAVALSIPFTAKRGCLKTSCRAGKISLLGLGISSSLRLCPAMAAVVLMAAEKGSLLYGLGYGAIFGLGLAISPLPAVGGGLAHIAHRLRLETGNLMTAIRGLAVLIMITMGLRLMLLATTP